MKDGTKSSFSLRYLFRWDGVVDRGPYLLVGMLGFGLKHNLDRWVATLWFGKEWGIFNYFIPPSKAVFSPSSQDGQMLMTLLSLSIPFIWVGLAMTLRRLRSTGLPLPLVFIFFIPVLNLFFFILMAVIPSAGGSSEKSGRPRGALKRFLDEWIPKSKYGSAVFAAAVAALIGGAASALSVEMFSTYGWTLFVATPFGMGLLAALLYGYHEPRTLRESVNVAVVSCLFLGAIFLGAAFEGVICLLMAAPIGIVLAAIGGIVGFVIQGEARLLRVLGALFLFYPAMMGMETLGKTPDPVFQVQSSVDIQAPPEKVWEKVVSFSEIPPPTELMFKLGIAYPIRAEIKGKGPGAVRHCIFSTGPFVEPIQVWDEPRLLKFTVTENPPPMQEWTPYKEIHPPHLRNFLVSNGGQFRLIPLPGGGTRLEGTTWYLHHMWPSSYWQVWSDSMIHKIHLRVLNHIKKLAEAKS